MRDKCYTIIIIIYFSSEEESSEYESSGDEAPAKKPASFTPAKNDGPFTLFCGRLSYNTTAESLEQFFTDNGFTVSNARVIEDRETGKSKGFGYVDLPDKASQKKALEFDGSELDGRTIRLDESSSKPSTPGGGRGRGGRGGRGGGFTPRTPNPPSANIFVKVSLECYYLLFLIYSIYPNMKF